ncbi:MAG: hypothetical protein GY861_09360 [bacterium]|nr:hypothetical protein [bacterium]
MHEDTNIAEKKFYEDLISNVTSKLTGSHDKYKRLILPNYPKKLLILGSLSEEDPNFMDNDSTSVKANSLTVMFMTDKPVSIKVKPVLSLYYGIKEAEGELEEYGYKRDKNVPFVWKRLKTFFPEVELNEDKKEALLNFGDYKKSIEGDIEHESLYEEKKPIYDWRGMIRLEIDSYPELGGKNVVKVQLINKTQPQKRKDAKYETSFFDCGLKIELGGIETIDFVDKRKNYFDNLIEIKSKFKTFNCGYNYDSERNTLVTVPFKKIEQKKVVPANSFEYNGEEMLTKFSDLSKSNKILKNLLEVIKEKLKEYQNGDKYGSDKDYTKITQNFENVLNRYEEGIKCLERNDKARKAFQLMQESFDKYTEKEEYHSWRIFQIVFIVSIIPDIVENKRRDQVGLLHVPTGGGKSESYFGLVVFSAFYDRLVGKKFGTTAITKFPLRMLSVDQLQRIAGIFIFAEEVRKNKLNQSGDFPFSVAYFVGSSDEFPRKTRKVVEDIQKYEKVGKEKEGKIIQECPLCGDKVILHYDKHNKIIHICKNDQCKKEYELFFTDEEIYRYLPTFIVSTVDKFAGIASQRRFRNLLGGKLNLCTKGHGFIPQGDFCEVESKHETCKDPGEPYEINFHTSPSLIIQDEMHLIREGFGTINSHFETFIEALSCVMGNNPFKHITMTATVKGAEQQNHTIYWKEKTNIFPWHSPLGKGENDIFYKKFKNKNQRIIIGLKPNFRDNQYATLITLRYLAEFINSFESNIEKYSKEYGVDPKVLKSIIIKYKSLMTYHNKKSDVNSMNFYMNDVVNSKLTRIDYSVVHNILSGDNTLDQIRDHIEKIKRFNLYEKKISALSCTSIVSHGVDISRWNFMCFQGVPGSTSEYIQALSRVGRKDTGLIFLWFYPNRVRDISFYDAFKEFHSQIDLFVETVPVERWTKLGFKQTFHSLFCGAILNYMSHTLNKAIYNVNHIIEVFFTDDNLTNNERKKQLIDFLNDAYCVFDGQPNSNFMVQEIAKGVNERLNALYAYHSNQANDPKVFFPMALSKNDKKYWKTQFGMRGIQDTIGLSNYEGNFIKRYRNE